MNIKQNIAVIVLFIVISSLVCVVFLGALKTINKEWDASLIDPKRDTRYDASNNVTVIVYDTIYIDTCILNINSLIKSH